jgi:hypothetical protein
MRTRAACFPGVMVVGAMASMGCGGGYRGSEEPAVVVVVVQAPGQDGLQVAHGDCAGDERIVNGDFESPALSRGTWQVFRAIEGWRTSSGDGPEIQNHVAGEPAKGQQYMELDSHSSSSIAQEVATEAGKRYRLQFSFSARADTAMEDNMLRVLWNGTLLTELVPKSVNPSWKTYSFPVTGRSGLSRLELQDAGQSNGLGTYVDAVSLVEICDE